MADRDDVTAVPDASPSAVSSEEVGAFAESYDLFAETLSRLEGSYRTLSERFNALNQELEGTNRRLQESLSEQERLSGYLNNLLESLGSGVVAVDGEGCTTLFNRAASDMLGVAPDDAIGKPVSQVLGEAGAQLALALEGAAPVRSAEKTLQDQAGRAVPVRYSTSRIASAGPAPAGAVETFDDISQLQELSKQASRVSTLTALGEMAATVAHEIRNPLGGIGGFAGLLERDLDVEDPRRRLVKKIVEGVESLNRMVTNLLNYTRPLQLNLRPVDFLEVVEDCLGFFEIDAGNRLDNVELCREFPMGTVPCKTDPEQIQQIVLNLLHNAVQAMPSGGQIRVGVSEADERAEAGGLSGPCITLIVVDSGIGMTDEVKEKLFMPFFTTKEDGNGLGLATARKVIEAHGGEILVDSVPHQGSTFTLFIPK
jgi:PAS domain S-box-containing protein